MISCFVDTETRGRVPIERGTDNYTQHAECIIVTWQLPGEPVQIWDRYARPAWPASLYAAVQNPEVVFIAHNSAFDRNVFRRSLGADIPIRRWRCTQAQAYAHGLPGSLELLGAVLGLPQDEQKLVDDKKLIRVFCIPTPDTHLAEAWNTPRTHPEQWERFKAYAIRDTLTLAKIHEKLPTHNYRGENLETWFLDQEINDRGFQFDTELAIAARQLLAAAKEKHDEQISSATSGGVTAVTQRGRLLEWLKGSGVSLPDMRAATIREWLEHDDLRPEHRFILELRLEGSKSSGSKYRRGMEVADASGRIRYSMQFSGAGRTGRWSGRGFQPQNLPRSEWKSSLIQGLVIPGIKAGQVLDNPLLYGGANKACSEAVRGAIVAASGNELVVADYSNIESRALAWVANETWKLDAYRAIDRGEGVDLYLLLVAEFFGVPIESLTKESPERQWGKVVDLSCGFLASVGAFVTMAAGYNMDLAALPALVLPRAKPEQQQLKAERAWRRAFLKGEDYGLAPDVFQACHVLVQMYRTANAEIFSTGHHVGRACKAAIENPGTLHEVAKCKIFVIGTALIIQLPSGRRLIYMQPRIHQETETDPATGKTTVYEVITYATARGKQWRRERAWAGLFIENIVQAIANDILRAAIRAVSAKWPNSIVLHVHDELVLETALGRVTLPELLSTITADVLAANPWLRGFPLAAAGWVGPRYKKG